jgi:uncharacterized membrane protein YbaN (DUF454 family)
LFFTCQPTELWDLPGLLTVVFVIVFVFCLLKTVSICYTWVLSDDVCNAMFASFTLNIDRLAETGRD